MSRTFLSVLIILTFLSSASVGRQPNPSDEARLSGLAFEQQIEENLRAQGFEIIDNRDWNEAHAYREPNLAVVVKNAPYRSIYGHRARIEFLMIFDGRQILIEVKRQRSSGSTDEKLPYVYANAQLNLAQGREFVLIMAGDGWKPGAVRWIEGRAGETTGFSVFKPASFLVWLKDQKR